MNASVQFIWECAKSAALQKGYFEGAGGGYLIITHTEELLIREQDFMTSDFMDFLFFSCLGDIICRKGFHNTFYVIDTHMYIWAYLASKDMILHQRNFLALKWYVARLHKRIIRSTKSFVDLLLVLMYVISHVDYCYLHNIPNFSRWSIWIVKCIGVSEKPFL